MSVVGKTKEAILKLLQQCLGHASPNISHYLFGFELNKDIKKSTFQQAGEYRIMYLTYLLSEVYQMQSCTLFPLKYR